MFKSEIRRTLTQVGVGGEINFSAPPKPELGDLSFACFDIAKIWKMSPVEAAKKIESLCHPHGSGDLPREAADSRFRGNDIVERVAAFGPYVNFYLNAGKIAGSVIEQIKKSGKNYGQNQIGNKKKVLIEYPSNNTHKELHVGHLRNICLGNALTQIFQVCGYQVIPINYINDFGSHVAKCLWGILKFHKDEKPPENKQKWLGEIYTETSQYLEEHPEDKLQVYELQTKLEKHDKSIEKLYKTTREWSLKSFAQSFAQLGVSHDRVFYEQDVKDIGQKMVDELLKKGIAQVGEGGAIIVDLKKYNLDIGLLRKSNGAGLYLTSDLGLAVAKNKKYPHIAESIHLTGSEQTFYFQQLFKILELAGYNYKMTHLPYGLLSLSSGKMSSRSGNVLLYEDLYDLVFNKTCQETKIRHTDWSEKKIQSAAKIIAMSALKFEILKHEAEKNVVFDPQSAVSFDGFTGPYVLYTVARINSIVKKSRLRRGFGGQAKIKSELLNTTEEKQLALNLAQYPEIVKKAFENYNPSVIVKYCFDISKLFNEFYNKHSVLNAPDADLVKARLALSLSVKQVLENALGLLTIGTVEEM